MDISKAVKITLSVIRYDESSFQIDINGSSAYKINLNLTDTKYGENINLNNKNLMSNLIIGLTKIEQNIFEYLINHIDKLVYRNEIAQIVLCTEKPIYSESALDKHMSNLRNKIHKYNYIIKTEVGQGYIMQKLKNSDKTQKEFKHD